MPRELEICTQISCPVMCAYCPRATFAKAYHADGIAKPTRMTTQMLAECLRSVPRSVVIPFCSFAEPFANPDCLDLMVVADAMGYKMSLCTTLAGLSERALTRLLRFKFKRIIYHVPTSDGHMQINVDDEYVRVAGRFMTDAACEESDAASFGPVHPLLNGFLSARLDVPHTRAGSLAPSPAYHKGPLRPCHKLFNGQLLPNGDVAMCCMDMGLQHIIGNLTQQTYQQIYEGEAFQSILRKRELDDCPDLLCRICDHDYC